jgi:subtilisin family serine protease
MLLHSRSGASTRRPSAGLRSTLAPSVGALLALLAACQDPAAPTNATALAKVDARTRASAVAVAGHAAPDEYIVIFRDDVADAPGLARQLVAQHGGSMRHTYTHALKGFSAKLPPHALEALRNNPSVASTEADTYVRATDVQLKPPHWGLDRLDQRTLPLDSAYVFGNTGSGTHAYIIDSGIRASHTEFGGRAQGVFTAIADGRGADDCTGHGTRVAGLLGSTKYGVAKGVKLYALRVFDCSDNGMVSGAVAALDWVVKNGLRPAVVNMSLGGPTSASLNAAVASASSAGIVVVVAAGNSATDACSESPASAPAALTIGATSKIDEQSTYSNWGSCVDVYAPGNNLRTTSIGTDTTTSLFSGTSAATPIAAGAVALYLTANPSAAPTQVTEAIVANATIGVLRLLGAGSPNRLLYTGFIDSSTVMAPAPTPAPETSPAPAPAAAAPAAKLAISCPSARGTCTLDASGSTSGATIAGYAWSFGDGGTRSTTTPSTSWQYRAIGSYTATVTVTDALGRTSRASLSVRIRKL